MYTEEQRKVMEELATPLVKWLNENTDPHHKIIIDTTSIELVAGQIEIPVPYFVKD